MNAGMCRGFLVSLLFWAALPVSAALATAPVLSSGQAVPRAFDAVVEAVRSSAVAASGGM